MTEESHFLEAVRARPDDTTLRLVYADWLEERGDVRGEFIRCHLFPCRNRPRKIQ